MEGCLQEGALGWDPTRRHLPQAVSGQQQSRCLPQLHTAPGSRHHTTVDLPAGTAPAAPIGRSSPFPENGSCGAVPAGRNSVRCYKHTLSPHSALQGATGAEIHKVILYPKLHFQSLILGCFLHMKPYLKFIK